jgi:hypothetical protein
MIKSFSFKTSRVLCSIIGVFIATPLLAGIEEGDQKEEPLEQGGERGGQVKLEELSKEIDTKGIVVFRGETTGFIFQSMPEAGVYKNIIIFASGGAVKVGVWEGTDNILKASDEDWTMEDKIRSDESFQKLTDHPQINNVTPKQGEDLSELMEIASSGEVNIELMRRIGEILKIDGTSFNEETPWEMKKLRIGLLSILGEGLTGEYGDRVEIDIIMINPSKRFMILNSLID